MSYSYPYGKPSDQSVDNMYANGARHTPGNNGGAISMFSGDQLPVKRAIVRNFGTFNRMFSATPTNSQPNHMFTQVRITRSTESHIQNTHALSAYDPSCSNSLTVSGLSSPPPPAASTMTVQCTRSAGGFSRCSHRRQSMTRWWTTTRPSASTRAHHLFRHFRRRRILSSVRCGCRLTL